MASSPWRGFDSPSSAFDRALAATTEMDDMPCSPWRGFDSPSSAFDRALVAATTEMDDRPAPPSSLQAGPNLFAESREEEPLSPVFPERFGPDVFRSFDRMRRRMKMVNHPAPPPPLPQPPSPLLVGASEPTEEPRYLNRTVLVSRTPSPSRWSSRLSDTPSSALAVPDSLDGLRKPPTPPRSPHIDLNLTNTPDSVVSVRRKRSYEDEDEDATVCDPLSPTQLQAEYQRMQPVP
jgi:hypothetical protein